MDLESPLGSLHKFYKIHNGVLFFRRFNSSKQWLVCILSVHEFSVVVSVHEFYGHVGAKKCATVLKKVCYFPNGHGRIRFILARCDLRQRTKYRTIRSEGLMQSALSTNPLDRVFVDLYGPLPSVWNGVSYIFVVLDNFSRFVKLYPLKRATALATTNRMIDHYIATYGKPKLIVSDHGVQFNSKSWQNCLSNLGVPLRLLSSSVDKCIHKLFMLYEGPFVVKEIKHKNAYVVSDPITDRVRGCFNVILLRPYLHK